MPVDILAPVPVRHRRPPVKGITENLGSVASMLLNDGERGAFADACDFSSSNARLTKDAFDEFRELTQRLNQRPPVTAIIPAASPPKRAGNPVPNNFSSVMAYANPRHHRVPIIINHSTADDRHQGSESPSLSLSKDASTSSPTAGFTSALGLQATFSANDGERDVLLQFSPLSSSPVTTASIPLKVDSFEQDDDNDETDNGDDATDAALPEPADCALQATADRPQEDAATVVVDVASQPPCIMIKKRASTADIQYSAESLAHSQRHANIRLAKRSLLSSVSSSSLTYATSPTVAATAATASHFSAIEPRSSPSACLHHSPSGPLSSSVALAPLSPSSFNASAPSAQFVHPHLISSINWHQETSKIPHNIFASAKSSGAFHSVSATSSMGFISTSRCSPTSFAETSTLVSLRSEKALEAAAVF